VIHYIQLFVENEILGENSFLSILSILSNTWWAYSIADLEDAIDGKIGVMLQWIVAGRLLMLVLERRSKTGAG